MKFQAPNLFSLVSYRPLSAETLPIPHDIDDDHHRYVIAAPHYELLEGWESQFFDAKRLFL